MKLPVIFNSPSGVGCSVNRSASFSSRLRGSALQSNCQARPSKNIPGEKAKASDARATWFCPSQGNRQGVLGFFAGGSERPGLFFPGTQQQLPALGRSPAGPTGFASTPPANHVRPRSPCPARTSATHRRQRSPGSPDLSKHNAGPPASARCRTLPETTGGCS